MTGVRGSGGLRGYGGRRSTRVCQELLRFGLKQSQLPLRRQLRRRRLEHIYGHLLSRPAFRQVRPAAAAGRVARRRNAGAAARQRGDEQLRHRV